MGMICHMESPRVSGSAATDTFDLTDQVRAALLGPLPSLPVAEGKLVLDFDNKPRDRQIMVQVLGE